MMTPCCYLALSPAMLMAAAAEADATFESSDALASSHLQDTSHFTLQTKHPNNASCLANKNDHCCIIFCSNSTFICASRSAAGATPAIIAAMAAGLMIGPLEVGVAVTTAAGVMLLLMPTLLPTAGCIGVLENPAAEARPVVEGWNSSESLAVAASARNNNPCIRESSLTTPPAPTDNRRLPPSPPPTSLDMRLLNVSGAVLPDAAAGLDTGGTGISRAVQDGAAECAL